MQSTIDNPEKTGREHADDVPISSRRFFIALFIAIFAGASGAYSQMETRRNNGVFAIEPPTPYTHYTPTGQSRGRMLVVHGLDSSKEIMNVFSLAMTDAGFEVYAIDLPGHGDSAAPFDGLVARGAVAAVLDKLKEDHGEEPIVVGHSLGAALLLDLANERDFINMALISPPPTPVDRIRAQRALILVGEFDIPRIKSFVAQLPNTGIGETEIRTIPWTGHTGAMFRPSIEKEIATWLGGDADNVHTQWRLTLLAAMIGAGCLLGVALLPGKAATAGPSNARLAVFQYAAAGAVATLVCALVPGMFSWLRLFATDYVIGFIFLAGIVLLALRGAGNARVGPALAEPFGIAFLAAAYVALVPGLWAGGNTLHLALDADRWWRFPLIGAAVLPLLLADEIYIRPIRPWWKAALLALATRLILAAFLVTGAVTFNRSAGILVVITHLIVLFWMVLWFAGEFVNRSARNAFATAIFAALVQAWLFAAVFITR